MRPAFVVPDEGRENRQTQNRDDLLCPAAHRIAGFEFFSQLKT
jgi:hypothetical protein